MPRWPSPPSTSGVGASVDDGLASIRLDANRDLEELVDGFRPGDDPPHAVVRHPDYLGGILFFVGTALCLGSLWALVPAGLASALLILRAQCEDQMLQAELAGYKEYTQRVRYKLIPGVW